MDFHNMKRKELQKLCKKHDIPANLSNLEMVDKLSSFFKVQEEEKVKPMRNTRSCLKNSDEMLSENEYDVLKKNLKKVRFSPENDVFQLGEKSERGFIAENKGGAGRVTRGRASLLCKTISISPVVMKRKGKRALQEVEEDLIVENRGGASRVTRARASLGKNVVISSPVVMKKRAKRAVQEIEKKDVDVESKGAVGRVTRARALVDEKVPIPSPVVMKKRGKKAVEEDEKGESVSENQGDASRVTRARAGKQVLIPSPVVMKKRGKQAVQEEEKGDLIVETKGGASRVTRARAGKQVLISSPVVMKKRGKRAVQEEKKSGSGQSLVVDFTNPGVEEENEVITGKFLRNRKVENVASPKNIVRKRNTQKGSQSFNAEVLENKDAKADSGITQPKMGLRRSTRNVNISEESERLLDETEEVSRKNSRQSYRLRASDKSSVEDVDIKTVAVEISQPEVVTRQSKRNRQLTDESIMYQTRRGTKRMSVIPQTKKAKTEKPVAGNLGKKNIVVKDSPNESTKPIVVEKGSEAGHIRRSKRNASGDGSPVSAEDANGIGTSVKTVTTKKRRREAVLEEVPSPQTSRRLNRKADNISDKLKAKTPVASEPRTRSGNGQASIMHSAKKLNVSGNLGPSSTAGEKASPHHTRELSTVPKRSATGARQLKTVAVTPRSRSGSGQKFFTHTGKKLRKTGSGLHSSIGDKESPHHSREISTVPRRSETVSKGKGSKSKHTLVVDDHSRRFTRSALKGKTDGPAYVRGKIQQKKSQSVSKLPLSKVESSLPKATSEGPLDIDAQSSFQEVDRSTVNFVSNASDLPEDKTVCSTPQGASPKTSNVDLNVQKSEGSEMINVHEVSHSARLNLQSNHSELEVDILTPQGGSPKTTGVDLNVQESEGPEMMNMCEASPSDPLNLQVNHVELEVDIATAQVSSPKTSSVDLNVQESEGQELINIREASPVDPLNVQSNYAEPEVDISTPEGGSPKTSRVDFNVQESEGPESGNIREASPTDTLNLQVNHAELEVDISTAQVSSPKTSSVDLNVQESECQELINIREASRGDPLNVQSNYAESEVDISTPDGGSPKTSRVDLNVQESEGPESGNIREASPSDTLNLQVNDEELEAGISTAQVCSPKTSSVDLNVQESEGRELINIREASPGDPLNVQSNYAEPEVDISTPEGGSPKTSRVDRNMQESEGPESGNMREASPSDTLNLQINHAFYGDVYEDNTTAAQREKSCETNVASPHLVDLEVDAAAGDGFPADTNTLADNSLVELSTSTRTEERPQLSTDVELVSKEIDLNLFFRGPAVLEDEPVNHSPLGEVAETADNSVTGESDAACVTQQQGPTEIDAKGPPLGHLKSSDDLDIIANAGSIDTGSVDDYHLNAGHMNSLTIKEKQEVSKNVNHVVAEGSTRNEEKSTAEVGDYGPTEQEHEIHKHPGEFAESSRLDKESNSASKEVGEAVSFDDIFFKTVSMDFTEDKDDKMHPGISVEADEPHNTSSKSGLLEKEFPVPNIIANTEEVSILEYDISKHPAEFAESDQLDKDSNSASKEVGEAESLADIFNQTFSMNFTEDKDDKTHPEISVQADEPPNTSSKSGMQEKEFPVTNSITNTEEVSILECEFSKSEFCDTVTNTVMCSNKELEEDNKQRLSTTESCLVQGEGCTNIFIEFSTSNVVADSFAGEENNSEPKAPSSPLHATEFDNTVVEVNEELKPEDSPLSWSSDILKRADVDGSSLQKERNSAKSVDVSEHSCSKNAKVKSENRKKVGAFDSSAREISDLPEFTSSLPSHVAELGQLVAEMKELKPKDSSSFWSTENVPKRTAEDGSSLHKRVGSEGREVEEAEFEDTVGIDSERTSSMFGDAHHTLDSQLPMERESVLEETMCSISGDVKERRMNKNISRERTPVISGDEEDEVDRDNISCPVIVHEFPSIFDHCHAPSEDSCGKEQGTDMSMVKSSKNFGKELPTQHDNCHGSLDSCWKEQGTPMSIVKSGINCGQEFSGQHDKIIEQVKVCSAAALPQTICKDFAGFGREMVADLMGSTIKHISSTSDLNSEKFEEIEPCTIINDKIVLGDGIESLKRNSSNLARNLVEDSGGHCEKSASEIIICDVSEEDRYGEDTIDSHQFEDSFQQFDVNYSGIDSNSKGICQENDKRPYLVQMDVDTNNVESSRDNLNAGDTVHRFDQEAVASAVPTDQHPRCEDAMDANAPAMLQYAGESVPLTGENEAQGVPTEELTKIEDAMDADAPANLQHGRESLPITGETNQAQERGPEEITFFSDIFGSELKSRSDEVGVDREGSHLWFDDTSFMLDKSEDAGKGLDVFMVSATKDLDNSGEEHVRVGNQHATAINTPGNGDDNVSVENSGGTLIESQLESETNKDAHQKVDCYNNNKSNEKFTGTES